jgi:hypothetical protein
LLWKLRAINPPRSALINTRGRGGGGGGGGRMIGRRGKRIHVAEEVFLELRMGRFVFRCKNLFVRSPLSSS